MSFSKYVLPAEEALLTLIWNLPFSKQAENSVLKPRNRECYHDSIHLYIQSEFRTKEVKTAVACLD